jgi:large subunit ribosomal protein L19
MTTENEGLAVAQTTASTASATGAARFSALKTGMVVRLHEIIKDVNAKGEERERTQIFEGTVMGFSGSGHTRTMTVRKLSDGVGVEKIYPLASPHVAKVDVVKEQRVRRAKLTFLRTGEKKRPLKEVKAKASKKKA